MNTLRFSKQKIMASSSADALATPSDRELMELAASPEGQVKLLQHALQIKEELAAARRENIHLRASQGMLESELRSAEQRVAQGEHARERDESTHRAQAALASLEAAAQRAAVTAELEQQEDTARQLQASAARSAASAVAAANDLAAAAVQRLAITAELEQQEDAARLQHESSRLAALAADAERQLLGSELGATERSLERSERRRARDTAIAVAATAAVQPLPRTPPADVTGTASARATDDGRTGDEASTGPSEVASSEDQLLPAPIS